MPGWTKLVGGWLLALSVAVALSWGAVAKVRNQVIPTPVEIPSTRDVVAIATVTSPEPVGVTETTVDSEVAIPDTTSTIADAPGGTGTPTTSMSTPETSSTSTTPQDPPTQATTSTAPQVLVQTGSYQLAGGVVNISYSPGVVNLVSAVPQPGYSTDQSESGPDRVRIRFKSDSHTSDFRAEWKSGELTITRNENGEAD